jgi:branched-subunit amino acid ABC-type transport system permease component
VTFVRLLRAWLIILPFMIVNGLVRELIIKQFVSPSVAEAISAAMGLAIIVAVTRFTLRPLAGKPTAGLIRASITLVLLTLVFEFAFGHYVDRRSWSELLANYEIWNGRLWPIVLATIAFAPFLWGRWSIEEERHAR